MIQNEKKLIENERNAIENEGNSIGNERNLLNLIILIKEIAELQLQLDGMV